MLYLPNGDIFATGVVDYEYRPIPPDLVNHRIILYIFINKFPTLAVIDTGAPYLIIAPTLAKRLDLDPQTSLEKTSLKIRGVSYPGSLYRISVMLTAAKGESQPFDATAFIVDADQEDKWERLPTFLGIEGCLDRIRFAVDPSKDHFYFGAIP